MHTGPSSSSAAEQRARLLRRGLWLEYITLGWNVVGVVVLAIAAFAAHSVALAGFGRDSLIEILASTVVVWQLTDTAGDREHVAMRVIGGAFFALAVYIAAQAIYQLASGRPPAPSPLGIVWTAITCAAMLALAFGKARTGAALDNPPLTTEGRVTLVDAYLAGAVLVGLVLNAAWGWGGRTRWPASSSCSTASRKVGRRSNHGPAPAPGQTVSTAPPDR